MTVANSNAKAGPYIGDGVTRSFTFLFPVPSADTVVVYVDGDILPPGKYSVAIAEGAGTVTLSEPLAKGSRLAILRNVPIDQEMDLRNNEAFFAEVLEKGYDKLTMIAQQLAEQISRASLIPPTGGVADDIAAQIEKRLREELNRLIQEGIASSQSSPSLTGNINLDGGMVTIHGSNVQIYPEDGGVLELSNAYLARDSRALTPPVVMRPSDSSKDVIATIGYVWNFMERYAVDILPEVVREVLPDNFLVDMTHAGDLGDGDVTTYMGHKYHHGPSYTPWGYVTLRGGLVVQWGTLPPQTEFYGHYRRFPKAFDCFAITYSGTEAYNKMGQLKPVARFSSPDGYAPGEPAPENPALFCEGFYVTGENNAAEGITWIAIGKVDANYP